MRDLEAKPRSPPAAPRPRRVAPEPPAAGGAPPPPPRRSAGHHPPTMPSAASPPPQTPRAGSRKRPDTRQHQAHSRRTGPRQPVAQRGQSIPAAADADRGKARPRPVATAAREEEIGEGVLAAAAEIGHLPVATRGRGREPQIFPRSPLWQRNLLYHDRKLFFKSNY